MREEKGSKEKSDKLLLKAENYIGSSATVCFLGAIYAAALIDMPVWAKALVAALGGVMFIWGVYLALKAEQTAGYYECSKCGARYVPTFKAVFFAPHMGRTRYMRCPECGEKSWSKKVLEEK